MRLDLAAGDGLAQLGGQGDALVHAALVLALVEHEIGGAFGGAAQRRQRVLQQQFGFVAIRGRKHGAGAGTQAGAQTQHLGGFPHAPQQFVRQSRHAVGITYRVAADREAGLGDARQHAALIEAALQLHHQRAQRGIAGGGAQRLLQAFDAVDTQQDQRKVLVAGARALQLGLQVPHQHDAIGQAGELVLVLAQSQLLPRHAQRPLRLPALPGQPRVQRRRQQGAAQQHCTDDQDHHRQRHAVQQAAGAGTDAAHAHLCGGHGQVVHAGNGAAEQPRGQPLRALVPAPALPPQAHADPQRQSCAQHGIGNRQGHQRTVPDQHRVHAHGRHAGVMHGADADAQAATRQPQAQTA